MEATTGFGPLAGDPVRRSGSRSRHPPRSGLAREAAWPRTTRLLPWALFGFVAMVWVVPFDSVNLPVGGPVDASLDRPFLVILACAWLLVAEPRRRGRGRPSAIHWAFAAFTAVAVVSVLIHAEDLVRVGGLDLAIKQLALLLSYGAFFALSASIIRPAEATPMVTGLIVLATITALAVIVEYRTGINVFHDWIGPLLPGYVRPGELGSTDSIGRSLMFGPTVQPLAVAVMLSMALPFALAWLLKAQRRGERLTYSVVVVILIAGAVATEKKTSLIGPLACILVLIAYRPRAMLRLTPLAVALVAVVHFTSPGAVGAVVDQFAPGRVTGVDTTRDRLSDYDAIKPDLAAHPLVGRGYGSYDQKFHRILDNQYLGLAIGIGLLGVLAFLAIFVTSFLSAHRAVRAGDPDRGPPALGAAAAIVVALVSSALLDFLSFPQLPYIFCFIAALAFALGREQLEREAR